MKKSNIISVSFMLQLVLFYSNKNVDFSAYDAY